MFRPPRCLGGRTARRRRRPSSAAGIHALRVVPSRGGVATGHTPTPSHFSATFREGGGGEGGVWDNDFALTEKMPIFVHY